MKNLSQSIVFVTGAFLSYRCWDEWKSYFEKKGYSCLAPAGPYKDDEAEELRNRHPDENIASIRLEDSIEYFTTILNTYPEKPILISHSLGGLIVQLLLQQQLGVAGVAIHSFPPQSPGMINLSLLKSLWDAAGFFTPVTRTYMISFEKWRYHIANGMTCEEQKQSYYEYAIPESKLAIRDSFKSVANIKFNDPHPPLLIIAGGQDQTVPASINHKNYKRYKAGRSITDYREFSDRNHLAFGHPGWQEDADFILYWLSGLTR